jgi:prefoldin subunit 5
VRAEVIMMTHIEYLNHRKSNLVQEIGELTSMHERMWAYYTDLIEQGAEDARQEPWEPVDSSFHHHFQQLCEATAAFEKAIEYVADHIRSCTKELEFCDQELKRIEQVVS